MFHFKRILIPFYYKGPLEIIKLYSSFTMLFVSFFKKTSSFIKGIEHIALYVSRCIVSYRTRISVYRIVLRLRVSHRTVTGPAAKSAIMTPSSSLPSPFLSCTKPSTQYSLMRKKRALGMIGRSRFLCGVVVAVRGGGGGGGGRVGLSGVNYDGLPHPS